MICRFIFALFGALTIPALAQVTVTVSNGPRTARRTFLDRGIPGVVVKDVRVCASVGTRVSSSEVIQAAALNNQSLFSPGSIDLLTVRKSLAEISADTAELASLAGAFITGSVKMPPSEKTMAVTVSAGAGLLAHWLATKLAPATPTAPAARLRALELPQEITVPVGGCWVGSALGRS